MALSFDPSGTSERVELSWDGETLLIQASGRERRVEAHALRLSRGGFSGRGYTLAWDGEEGRTWAVAVDETEAASLLRDLPVALGPAYQGVQVQVRRERRRGRMLLAGFAFVVLVPLLLLLLLYAVRDRVIDGVIQRLPTSVDRRLGEMAASQLLPPERGTATEAASARVRAEGVRLLAAAGPNDFAFRFEVLDDATVNAFAAPGGLVVVHSGLLEGVQSPDELAGVLAHEITHVLERHSLRQMVFGLGVTTLARLAIGEGGGTVDAIAGQLGNLGSLSFSREQETAADRGAVRLLGRAGISPGGLLSFFARMAEQGGDPPRFLSSHPLPAERLQALRAEIASTP